MHRLSIKSHCIWPSLPDYVHDDVRNYFATEKCVAHGARTRHTTYTFYISIQFSFSVNSCCCKRIEQNVCVFRSRHPKMSSPTTTTNSRKFNSINSGAFELRGATSKRANTKSHSKSIQYHLPTSSVILCPLVFSPLFDWFLLPSDFFPVSPSSRQYRLYVCVCVAFWPLFYDLVFSFSDRKNVCNVHSERDSIEWDFVTTQLSPRYSTERMNVVSCSKWFRVSEINLLQTQNALNGSEKKKTLASNL